MVYPTGLGTYEENLFTLVLIVWHRDGGSQRRLFHYHSLILSLEVLMSVSETHMPEGSLPATQVSGLAPAQSLAETASRGRIALVLAGVMLGVLLGALDQTVVGTAMPRIIAELNGL